MQQWVPTTLILGPLNVDLFSLLGNLGSFILGEILLTSFYSFYFRFLFSFLPSLQALGDPFQFKKQPFNCGKLKNDNLSLIISFPSFSLFCLSKSCRRQMGSPGLIF